MGNRVDYTCPGCGNEAWAYSMWAGNRCWQCPGTIAHGIVKLPVLRVGETIATSIADIKTHYKCPRCNDDVWAYGQFVGQTCWDCKRKNPLDYLDIVGEVGTSVAVASLASKPLSICLKPALIASSHTVVRKVGGTVLEVCSVNETVGNNIFGIYK